MFEKFNNNFQDTVANTPNTGFNPYQQSYFGQNDKTPYVEGMMQSTPSPMPGNVTEDNLYPLESSLATPYLNTPVSSNNSISSYKNGGEVRTKGKKAHNNLYPLLAEMIRQQGKGEDTILAHINPLEAMILKNLGGSGTINPKTGLPQFGLFSNPGKWLKSVAGPALGTVVGNMILPGIGGIIGGGLGGALGSKARGRKDYGQAALRGASIGAIAPTIAGFAGSGFNSLGANNAGGYLTNYGNQNAIMPSLGRLMGNNTVGNYVGSIGQGGSGGSSGIAGGSANNDNLSFTDKLIGKSKDFFSEPANLLTTGVLASSFLNRPKKETPAKRARDEKEYQKALMLNAEELQQKEAQDLALEQMKRRIDRNKFLPEERLQIDPLYVKTNTPEEYKKQRKWLNYYNNPDYTGNPVMMKKGGSALSNMMFAEEEMEYPSGMGRYIVGETKGQDDKIPAILSDGEFVFPADVVSDVGDGNNAAGAKEFYKLMSNIRKHKRGGKIGLPPKAKSLVNYMRD